MPGAPLSRRNFILASGAGLVAATGLGAEAFLWAPRRLEVSRHEVPIPGLPAALAGLRIVHVTDLHFLTDLHAPGRRAMELVAAEAPDVTLVTGDLTENATLMPEVESFLRGVRGRLATVVTMGNWEYLVGVSPEMLRRTAERAGASLLFNETLTVEQGGARLAIVGLDDPRLGFPDPALALRELPADATPIWAFHAPGYADLLVRRPWPRPALIVAGHTHGGQILLPLAPVITPTASGRFISGWYRDTFAPMYVNRGVGTSGIRARFRCPPEVAVFTLRPA